jgi:hypothetical protein
MELLAVVVFIFLMCLAIGLGIFFWKEAMSIRGETPIPRTLQLLAMGAFMFTGTAVALYTLSKLLGFIKVI